jgi:hypothetical protein
MLSPYEDPQAAAEFALADLLTEIEAIKAPRRPE